MVLVSMTCPLRDFYPRSPCGERLVVVVVVLYIVGNFYPRSPCGERRHIRVRFFQQSPFLSTLSLRRATPAEAAGADWLPNFYPRSPCGERPYLHVTPSQIIEFLSTLSLRRATLRLIVRQNPVQFLSTLSLRRATDNLFRISYRNENFYPRSPCGERHQDFIRCIAPGNFYPRSPCGERHARHDPGYSGGDFYPRSPCGERPHRGRCPAGQVRISIHALLAESDRGRTSACRVLR